MINEPNIEHFYKLNKLCSKLNPNKLHELKNDASIYVAKCSKYLSWEDKEKLKKIWNEVYPYEPFPHFNPIYGSLELGLPKENPLGVVKTIAFIAIIAWFSYYAFIKKTKVSPINLPKTPNIHETPNINIEENESDQTYQHDQNQSPFIEEGPTIEQSDYIIALEKLLRDAPINYARIKKLFPKKDKLNEFITEITTTSSIIVIDPAGTAFNSNQNYDNAATLSRAIYDAFDLKGVHQLGILKPSEILMNPKSLKLGDITTHILHVIGPDGNTPTYTEDKPFYDALYKLISYIFQKINELQSSGEITSPVTVLCPFIAGGLFLGKKRNKYSYMIQFTRAVIQMCGKYPNIKVIHNNM